MGRTRTSSNSSFDRVWRQTAIPVIAREWRFAPLVVRLPYRQDNREWLRHERRSKPKWLAAQKIWSIPKAWFEDTIRRALDRFNAIWVIQPSREIEKCAPACWSATGVECQCSCLGANHGTQNPAGRWYVISDTFAFRVGAHEFSCNLLKRGPPQLRAPTRLTRPPSDGRSSLPF